MMEHDWMWEPSGAQRSLLFITLVLALLISFSSAPSLLPSSTSFQYILFCANNSIYHFVNLVKVFFLHFPHPIWMQQSPVGGACGLNGDLGISLGELSPWGLNACGGPEFSIFLIGLACVLNTCLKAKGMFYSSDAGSIWKTKGSVPQVTCFFEAFVPIVLAVWEGWGWSRH